MPRMPDALQPGGDPCIMPLMSAPPIDLGPFRLDHIAGRGATADVWAAAHRQRGVPVAIKVLSGIRPDDDVARRRFVDEVRAMAALDHRAIIRLHDYGEVPVTADIFRLPPGRPYLVMDWHADGTLHTRLGRVRFAELRRLVGTLLDALGHAHARGVVHRDLKPANVLIGASGPVIADFGLVFGRDGDGDGRAGGTPNYMSPEQVRGDWRSFGPWSDLYAVGCLAWALATGRAPYAGSGARRAMEAHLEGVLPPFQPAHAMPPGFQAWLGRLLDRDPADRFRFAADARAALEALPDPGSADFTERTLDPCGATIDPAVDGFDPTVVSAPAIAVDGPGRLVAGDHPDRPPMDMDWRRPLEPWTAHLPGCGRDLVELRVPPLRGRTAERERLWARLSDVVHGRGARAVILSGGAGLGKTRLMGWLAERAHAAGQADGLRVEHAPVPTAVHGLGPIFTRHLRLTGMPPEDAARRLARGGFPPMVAGAMAAVDCGGRLDLGPVQVTLDSEGALFDAIADGLEVLARHRALVVQIDDAQWGPEAVRLVEHVLDQRPELPALFVLTVRTRDPGRPVIGVRPETRRALELLAHRPEVDAIELRPLDARAHGEVAAARLPLTADTAERLAGITGGNPLFADELLRHWLHMQVLEETPDGFRLPPDRPDARPPSLAELWRTRLDRLLGDMRPDPLPALELAATLGASVDPDEWRVACERAGLARPDAAVERLLDHGLVRRSGGRLVFAHGLLREALEDRARDAGRAARWHAACADALLTLAARRGEPPDRARRAAHLAAAGRPEEAVPLWLDAARERMRRGWHKDIRPAIALFDAVLAHRPDDGAVLADAAICRARLGWLSAGRDDRRQLDAARDFAERAIAAAPFAGRPYRALATVHHYRGQPLAAIRRLEQAIEREPTDGESHAMAGRVMAETGPLDRATHHLTRALALGADSVDLRIELARTHAYRGEWLRIHGLLWDPDPREAQRALADIALARFALWRGPEHRDPWSTRPPAKEPSAIAELFRAVNRKGRAGPQHYRWLEARAHRALAAGARRRATLFLQSVTELAGYSGDVERTRSGFEAALDAGLTDRMWATHCPLLAPIADSDTLRDGRALIDARLRAETTAETTAAPDPVEAPDG